MATLEETFLADLEDLSDASDVDAGQDGEDVKMEEVLPNQAGGSRSVSDLPSSEHYQLVMQGVRELMENMDSKPEQSKTYSLMLQCLELVVSIDNEVANLHNYMKDLYKTKFVELASFVKDPVLYAKTIKRIGNEMDLTKINLEDVLQQHDIMAVTVTATTTSGKPLEEKELQSIIEAGDVILQLDCDKSLILRLVEMSMHIIAPNLSQAIGEEIAARLIGAAGGLEQLSRIPACNVQVLGQQKKALSGFSTANVGLHRGFIYSCDIIDECPEELRNRAARLVGAKVSLLARVDAYGTDPTGSQGATMKDEMLRKIEKWQELPSAKLKNVLPVPDLEPKKRRGGKRWRKMKEKYGVTEFQKAQNRMKFNEAEEEIIDGDEVVGLGMTGKAGIGKLGVQQVRQTKVKMSNKTAKRLSQQNKHGLNSAMVSGLSSSLSFTPVQGIELENPSAKAPTDRNSGTETYFSDYTGFKSHFK